MSEQNQEERIAALEKSRIETAKQMAEILKSSSDYVNIAKFLQITCGEQLAVMVQVRNDQTAVYKWLVESRLVGADHRQELRDLVARSERTGERMEHLLALFISKFNPPPPPPPGS